MSSASLNQWEMTEKLRLLSKNKLLAKSTHSKSVSGLLQHQGPQQPLKITMKSLQDQFTRQNNSIIRINAKYASQIRKQEAQIMAYKQLIYTMREDMVHLTASKLSSAETCLEAQRWTTDLTEQLKDGKQEMMILVKSLFGILDRLTMSVRHTHAQLDQIDVLKMKSFEDPKDQDQVKMTPKAKLSDRPFSPLETRLSLLPDAVDGIPPHRMKRTMMRSSKPTILKAPADNLFAIAEYEEGFLTPSPVPSPPASFFNAETPCSEGPADILEIRSSPLIKKSPGVKREVPRLETNRRNNLSAKVDISQAKTPSQSRVVLAPNPSIANIPVMSHKTPRHALQDQVVLAPRTTRSKPPITYSLPNLKNKLRQGDDYTIPRDNPYAYAPKTPGAG